MAESHHAGQKRPSPSSTTTTTTTATHPRKKRKVLRTLHHIQHKPAHTERAPQDPVFIQAQLLRSIGAALAMAGFDSVKASAMEMFRGCVEEYILHFLNQIQKTMRTSRRTTPTPLDFLSALAQTPNTSTAAHLSPHLHLQLPPSLTSPTIQDPTTPPPAPAQNFSALLAPLVVSPTQQPEYIPRHFPPLPPQHAWKTTPVLPARELDKRRLRERATEEGVLAESALRRLAGAAKTKGGKVGQGGRLGGERNREDGFKDMIREVGGSEGGLGGVDVDLDADLELGGSGDGARHLREEEGVVVNWDTAGWRRGGGGRRGVRV